MRQDDRWQLIHTGIQWLVCAGRSHVGNPKQDGYSHKMSDRHKIFNHAMTCAEFDRYMDAMREEVARHKWFLSEKAGRDVGELFAFEHWSKNHQAKWDADWRANVCTK